LNKLVGLDDCLIRFVSAPNKYDFDMQLSIRDMGDDRSGLGQLGNWLRDRLLLALLGKQKAADGALSTGSL
jgi:hypothetical protein